MNLRRAPPRIWPVRALLKSERFDLCLTDMRLPDGDGLDLVAWIQEHHDAVPVAVITAHGNVESAVRALKLGAFDFVSKPLDLGVLRKLVGSAIKLRVAMAEETAATPARTRACSALTVDGAAARDDRSRRAQSGAGAHLR
jgi:DNA-binding NtrC family response regulator